MHTYEELKEMMRKELEELVRRGELSADTLGIIHILTDVIKNVYKIKMYERYEDEDYSERDAMYADGRSYNDESSYARRRRNSKGQYSRGDGYTSNRDYMRASYRDRRYSRADAKEDMIEQIEDMMENATSEKEREALQRCMTALQKS